ncbi:MAG TPA: hypothetical protein VHL80_03560 [Polyangia bacterium]|nr:hypothetical protein [Polyangia bacterium]
MIFGLQRVPGAARPRQARGRAVLAWAPCAAFSAAALAGFVAVAGHALASTFAAALVWGALVLASFVGWGTLLARRLVPGRPVDPALRAAWGVALFVAAGGVLSMLCLVSRGRIGALVAGGLLGVALDLGARRAALLEAALAAVRRRPRAVGVALGLAALGLLALVQAASAGLTQAYYWNCDDGPAYLVFPAEMLSAGCAVQPFSIRGLNSYGGQPFMNAVIMSQLPTTAVFLFDRGLCLLITFGLVLWYPLRRRALALLPLALLVTLPDIRANTTSTMSTAVLLVAAFRTLELPVEGERLPAPVGALLALVVVALAAMRQSGVVPAAAIVALAYGGLLARAAPGERRAVLRDLRRVALLGLALMLPWVITSFRSARALAHPLLSFNYHPEVGAYAAGSRWYEVSKRLWANFTYERVIKTLPLFLLAGLLLKEDDRRRPLGVVFWASLLGALALIWTFAWGNPADNERVLFASALATALCVSLATLRKAETPPADGAPARPTETFLPAIVACGAILLQLDGGRAATAKLYAGDLDLLEAGSEAPPPAPDPEAAQYAALQAAIPPGARVLTMLDRAYWLDFRRNKLDVIDLVGMVSPRPGLPLDSDDAFASYLLGQHIRYFAFVRKESSIELYKGSTWVSLARNPDPSQRTLAPLFFKGFERADSLARTRAKIFERNGMVVVDLATPAGRPPAP